MRLGEIMGAAGLQVFAEIGLVMFLILFAGVLVYTFTKRNRSTFERARTAPLDEAPRAASGRARHE
jgi:cbb3-type cytochrome oxidase subunit 3